MNNFKKYGLALFSILIISCTKTDTSPKDITLTLKLENNGDPVVGFESFEYPGGYDLFLTKFSMFISQIELIDENQNSVQIPDVLWVDLLSNVQNVETAEKGFSFVVNDLPYGNYKTLKASIGVPSDLNKMQPAEFESTHPLSNTGEYWVGWSSYIFHKTEGKLDSDGDGEFETNIALHIGSDAAFRTAEYDIEMELKDRDNIELVFDINDIFNIDDQYYDFIETPQIHHLGLLPKALPIMDGLSTEVVVR